MRGPDGHADDALLTASAMTLCMLKQRLGKEDNGNWLHPCRHGVQRPVQQSIAAEWPTL